MKTPQERKQKGFGKENVFNVNISTNQRDRDLLDDLCAFYGKNKSQMARFMLTHFHTKIFGESNAG